MGWKLSRIDLTGCHQIKPNEEIDLCIELEKECRAAIHGVVKFPNGKPVEGAVVKLFKKNKEKCEKKYEDKCEEKYERECDKFEKGYDKGYDKYDKDCDLIPVTFTFTDECGQFLFGVESEKDYVIKVFFYKPEKYPNCQEKK